DLHSGNILQDLLHNAYITDLGLSTSSDIKQDGKIHGVMPYVAPEVLIGQQFTQAADIYSFGVIMTEISSGKKAFDSVPFDTKLAIQIRKGNRPEFGKGTPKCYVKLAKRCMDFDPNRRPTATIISSRIVGWLDDMEQEDEMDHKDEMEQKNDNDVKKQFLEADKLIPKIETPTYPSHIYTSKLIDTEEINKALN
ncbi:3837_t:CDS:1, partial [Cetraspora pellucida]